jgi:hypothetical protein
MESSFMTMERKPAAELKRERIRGNRAAARASAQSKASRRDQHQHDREVAVRMTRRFFPSDRFPGGPPLLTIDYRYWQARRCGWDALADKPRVSAKGLETQPMSDAEWRWWTRLHYETRGYLVRLSAFKLTRR